MACAWHIVPLLFATVVWADYYIDNANTSVTYSMAPSQSGTAWQTFSTGTQALELKFSNSTGNYSILLDASDCYDQNYALGVCGTNDNCYVQIPFVGSGITMYVFDAGSSGMTASFSVDGGTAVSKTIPAPTAQVNYQVSNVSLYDIQGIPTGNHTMRMTMLDWNGSATSMKFDYAYVNETFVTTPKTTSSTSSMTSTSTTSTQTPTQTPSASSSNQINLGAVIGGTLGGVAILASAVIGFFCFRKRKTIRRDQDSSRSSMRVNPFTSEQFSSTPPTAPYARQRTFVAQHAGEDMHVPSLQRSAILRDALATGSYPSEPTQSSQSTMSGMSSPTSLDSQPLRRQTSYNTNADLHATSNASHVVDRGSPFSEPSRASRDGLTTEQLEIIDRLREDKVPAETIARVIEGFVSARLSVAETSSAYPTRAVSILSALPPPSYRTRDR